MVVLQDLNMIRLSRCEMGGMPMVEQIDPAHPLGGCTSAGLAEERLLRQASGQKVAKRHLLLPSVTALWCVW